MDRRRFIARTAAFSAIPFFAQAADETPESKVFMDYTQAQLDAAYTQGDWAPNAKALIDAYDTDSARVREKYPPKTLAYGAGDAETMDVFAPKDADSRPIVMFIHGGAWRSLSKSSVSAHAPLFVDNNVIYIAIDFNNLPNNTLPGMAEQCRRALMRIARVASTFGGDPQKIYVAGHSSGAQLASVLLTTDWSSRGESSSIIRGGILLSGPYDLKPVMLSSRAKYVKITDSERDAMSAGTGLDRLQAPVLVAWGSEESPEFKRQGRQFADAVKGRDKLVDAMVLDGLNHFEVPNQLNRPDSALAKAVLKMVTA